MIKRCENCSCTIDSGILCDPCYKPNVMQIANEVMKEIMEEQAPVLKKLEQGTKYDQGKPDLTIVPVEAIESMARAFMYGAKKYSRGNFKKGLEVNRTLAAALRHIYAFSSGENLDPESGESHLSHALAALAMTVYNLKHNPQMDDR